MATEELEKDTVCLRCGYTWTKRTKNPKRCPKCKSPQWNVPRKSQKREV